MKHWDCLSRRAAQSSTRQSWWGESSRGPFANSGVRLPSREVSVCCNRCTFPLISFALSKTCAFNLSFWKRGLRMRHFTTRSVTLPVYVSCLWNVAVCNCARKLMRFFVFIPRRPSSHRNVQIYAFGTATGQNKWSWKIRHNDPASRHISFITTKVQLLVPALVLQVIQQATLKGVRIFPLYTLSNVP